MIISQTPLRISFVGGGTDLPAFCNQEYGAVVSAAITSYTYITVNRRFDSSIRVAYSKTEIVDSPADLEHTIVRAALRVTGIEGQIEITTIGDVPAGTGTGSSSSLTVGLLNALYAYQGKVTSPRKLAEEACHIELDVLSKPIGRQDQYASAYGGVNYMRFNGDGSVDVEPLPCKKATIAELESRAMLMYTGRRRDADEILTKQSNGTRDRMPILRQMRDLAEAMRQALAGDGDLDEFSRIMREGWKLKRSLGFGITNQEVDDWYSAAIAAGAECGKLLGAGGGGFLFLLVPPSRQDAVREALDWPIELDVAIAPLGSRIIFISDRE